MKKSVLASILGMSLVVTLPSAAFGNEAHVKWTNVNDYETQEASGSLFNAENYDFLKYSQLPAFLQNLAEQSNRITVKVQGQSAEGRPMYVVTVSQPEDKGKFGYYQGLRKLMFKNPDKAQAFIDKHPDFKAPIFINASIHGTEFVGTDAVTQLLERFALQNDAETQSILQNNILIFNVTANPDGRVDATRFNGNGIDLNRDFVTQSQPETKQTVELLTEWNPMVMLDLHGYVKHYAPNKQGLIEPCTPPHNPNYEYDLYQKWAVAQAEAMEAEIMGNQSEYEGTIYQNMVGTYIPQRDDAEGWDDYPPIFTPMYAMYHGAYGYTLEAPTNDLDGVKWQYDAIMGALKYATANKSEMIKDQIEVFKRGINFDHPFHADGFFPNAYILPVDETDPTVTEKAVQHLLNNDVEVEVAKQLFSADGVTYPAGTYLVKLDQAKAGLANTLLWDGEDISDQVSAMYDISAWSLPELWGFAANPTYTEVTTVTAKVTRVDGQGELIGKGPYLIPNSSVKAVELVNNLLNQGIAVQRDGQGNFYVAAQKGNALKAAVQASGLTVTTAASVPSGATALEALQVAILKDGGMNKQQSHSGTKLALERLGFHVTERTPVEVATQGLGDADVFFYSGNERLIEYVNSNANKEFGLQSKEQQDAFKANVTAFVNGGGKYVAVGASASRATQKLGLATASVSTGSSNANGIVQVDYAATPLTYGYGADDIGFVYRPVWYTNTAGYTVAATLDDSPGFFLAGHWQNRSAAQGQAVILKDNTQDVTLIGLEAGFRDHTDYLFRLLSNAVFE